MSFYCEPWKLPSLLLQFVLLRFPLRNSCNSIAMFLHIPLDDYRMQTHSYIIIEGTYNVNTLWREVTVKLFKRETVCKATF